MDDRWPVEPVIHASGLLFEAPEQGDLFGPQFLVGSLQDDGDIVESGILHETFEEGESDEAFADAVVAVYAGGECFHAVVQMDSAKIIETNDPVEFLPNLIVGSGEVIAGSEGVACIHADAHPAFVFHEADDVGQLFQAVAHVRTLTCSVFDDGCYAGGLVKGDVDTLGDASEAFFRCFTVEVAAGVEVEAVEAELFATLHLVKECFPRFR